MKGGEAMRTEFRYKLINLETGKIQKATNLSRILRHLGNKGYSNDEIQQISQGQHSEYQLTNH